MNVRRVAVSAGTFVVVLAAVVVVVRPVLPWLAGVSGDTWLVDDDGAGRR